MCSQNPEIYMHELILPCQRVKCVSLYVHIFVYSIRHIDIVIVRNRHGFHNLRENTIASNVFKNRRNGGLL